MNKECHRGFLLSVMLEEHRGTLYCTNFEMFSLELYRVYETQNVRYTTQIFALRIGRTYV